MGEEVKSSRQESRAGKWLSALTVSLMVTFLGVLAISFTMSRLHFGSDVLRGLCRSHAAGKANDEPALSVGAAAGPYIFPGSVSCRADPVWKLESGGHASAGSLRRRRNAGGNVLVNFAKKLKKR